MSRIRVSSVKSYEVVVPTNGLRVGMVVTSHPSGKPSKRSKVGFLPCARPFMTREEQEEMVASLKRKYPRGKCLEREFRWGLKIAEPNFYSVEYVVSE